MMAARPRSVSLPSTPHPESHACSACSPILQTSYSERRSCFLRRRSSWVWSSAIVATAATPVKYSGLQCNVSWLVASVRKALELGRLRVLGICDKLHQLRHSAAASNSRLQYSNAQHESGFSIDRSVIPIPYMVNPKISSLL